MSADFTLTPKDVRVAKAPRIRKIVSQVPRCAALTEAGTQCRGTFGSTGQGGGHITVDGETVPLCTVHLFKAFEAGLR